MVLGLREGQNDGRGYRTLLKEHGATTEIPKSPWQGKWHPSSLVWWMGRRIRGFGPDPIRTQSSGNRHRRCRLAPVPLCLTASTINRLTRPVIIRWCALGFVRVVLKEGRWVAAEACQELPRWAAERQASQRRSADPLHVNRFARSWSSSRRDAGMARAA